VYSPSNQQLVLELEFDNGTCERKYEKLRNERITITKECGELLNMNSITNVKIMNHFRLSQKKL
jgi:hypothetical protein